MASSLSEDDGPQRLAPQNIPDDILADFGNPGPGDSKKWREYPLGTFRLRDAIQSFFSTRIRSNTSKAEKSKLLKEYKLVADPDLDTFPASDEQEFDENDQEQAATVDLLRHCHNALLTAREGAYLSGGQVYALANRLLHLAQRDGNARLGPGSGRPTGNITARWWICPHDASVNTDVQAAPGKNGKMVQKARKRSQPLLTAADGFPGMEAYYLKNGVEKFEQAMFTVHFANNGSHWMAFILHKPKDGNRNWTAFFLDSLASEVGAPERSYRRADAKDAFVRWLQKNSNDPRVQNVASEGGQALNARPALVFLDREMPTQPDGWSCSMQCIMNIFAFIRYESWGWDMIPHLRDKGSKEMLSIMMRMLHNLMGLKLGGNTLKSYRRTEINETQRAKDQQILEMAWNNLDLEEEGERPVYSELESIPSDVLADFGPTLPAQHDSKQWREPHPLPEYDLRDVFSDPFYTKDLGNAEPEGDIARSLIEHYRIVAHPELDKFPDLVNNEEYNDADHAQKETLTSVRDCHRGLYVARGEKPALSAKGFLGSNEIYALANRLLHWVQRDKSARLGPGPGKPTDDKKAKWWLGPYETHMITYKSRGTKTDEYGQKTVNWETAGGRKNPTLDEITKEQPLSLLHKKSRERFNQATFTIHFMMGEQHWMAFILHKPQDPTKNWNAFFLDGLDQKVKDPTKKWDPELYNRKNRQGAEMGFHDWMTKNFPDEERLQNCIGSLGVPVGLHPEKPGLKFHFRKMPKQLDGFSCSLQCIMNVLAFIRYESWGYDMIPYFRDKSPVNVVPIITRILHNMMGISVDENEDDNYLHGNWELYKQNRDQYALDQLVVTQRRAADKKKAEETDKTLGGGGGGGGDGGGSGPGRGPGGMKPAKKKGALRLGGDRIIKLLRQTRQPVYSVEQNLSPDSAPDPAGIYKLFNRLLDLPEVELFPTEIHKKQVQGYYPADRRMTKDTFHAFRHYEQALRDIRKGQPITRKGIVPLALRQLAALQAYSKGERGSYGKGDWYLLPTPYILTVGEPGNEGPPLVRLGESQDQEDGFYHSRQDHRKRFKKAGSTMHFVFWEKTRHWAVMLRETTTGGSVLLDSDFTFEGQELRDRLKQADEAMKRWLRHNNIEPPAGTRCSLLKARPSASESHWDSGLFTLLNLVARIHYRVYGWHQLPLQAYPEHTSIAVRRAQIRALHNLVGLKMTEGLDETKNYKSPIQPRFDFVSHPQFANKRWDGRNERDNAIALLRPPVASSRRLTPVVAQAGGTQPGQAQKKRAQGQRAKGGTRVQEIGEGEGHGLDGTEPSPETARSGAPRRTSLERSQVDGLGKSSSSDQRSKLIKCQKEKAQLQEENLDLLDVIQSDEREISRLENIMRAMRTEIIRLQADPSDAIDAAKHEAWESNQVTKSQQVIAPLGRPIAEQSSRTAPTASQKKTPTASQSGGPNDGALRGGAIIEAVSEEDYELNWRARRLRDLQWALHGKERECTQKGKLDLARQAREEREEVEELEIYWIAWKRRWIQLHEHGTQARAGGEGPAPPRPAWIPNNVTLEPEDIRVETQRYMENHIEWNTRRYSGLFRVSDHSAQRGDPTRAALQAAAAALRRPVAPTATRRITTLKITSSTEVPEDEAGNPLPRRNTAAVTGAGHTVASRTPGQGGNISQQAQGAEGELEEEEEPPSSPPEYEPFGDEDSEDEELPRDEDGLPLLPVDKDGEFSDADLPNDLFATAPGGAGGKKRPRDNDSSEAGPQAKRPMLTA